MKGFRAFALALLCLPACAAAHGDIHARLDALDRQIAAAPADAGLRLRRGRLQIEHGAFDAARADLERALLLAPAQHGARYFLAEALLRGGRPALAAEEAQRFIDAYRDAGGPQAQGALARGHWLLGEAQMAMHATQSAIAAYRSALGFTAAPAPEQYQLFADASAAAGGAALDEALRVIDQALAAGGSVDMLQGIAIDLELSADRSDAALRRLDALIAQGRRLPFLQARKAQILTDAGRSAEAAAALREAQAALDALPPKRRTAKAYQDLQAQIGALTLR